MPQEPHGGPHPPRGQITAQHPPELDPRHPAPQPLDGLGHQGPRLDDTQPQIGADVPKGQKHPLDHGLFAHQSTQTTSPRRNFGTGFGGWAGRVLHPFFIYR
ncbi:hypothetical protein AAGT00_18105 [Streptomyces cavourensis]